MTKIVNLALKIKGGGREGGTCPPKFGTCTSPINFRCSDTRLGHHKDE